MDEDEQKFQDKIINSFIKHQSPSPETLRRLDTIERKIDDKMDKGMFKWFVGIIITLMLGVIGAQWSIAKWEFTSFKTYMAEQILDIRQDVEKINDKLSTIEFINLK